MLRRQIAAAVLLFSALSLSAQTKVAPELLDRFARGERVRVIVALRERSHTSALPFRRARIAAVQDDVLQEVSSSFALETRWRNVAAFSGEMSIAALGELASHPDVLAISEDRGGTIATLESLPLIGAPAVHARGHMGQGVTVAVIDTGVERTHPDFAGRITDEQCFCRDSKGKACCPNGANAQRGAGAARDDHGHGTNVAGIIASGGAVAPKGVAPQANLVAIRVTDAAGNWAYTSQVISALDFLITAHPEVRVVNISLGTDRIFDTACDGMSADAMALASAVRTLRARGTAVFAASGNQASKNGVTFPACIDDIISVGAVYDGPGGYASSLCKVSITAANAIACFSNSGPNLDLLAPGASIISSGRSGTISSYGGTSQASPHAAGAAAIAIGIQPAITVAALEGVLRSTGTLIVDPRNGIGVPRIDVDRMASALVRTFRRRRAASH